MRLPQNLEFAATIHGPNERIPTDAIRFGTEAIYRLFILYGRRTDGPSSQA
jgi:acetylornithine deacetylase/succinyl-diaminopimelate desuccinylase-like protein